MILWLYCSYQGSPVGFQLCCTDCSASEPALSQGEPHPLLLRAFSAQGVREAWGKLPDSTDYIYVRTVDRQAGDKLYLNFALQTGDPVEYRRIIAHFRHYAAKKSIENSNRSAKKERSVEEQSLFEKIASFVEPDSENSEFAIRVNRDKLREFLGEVDREQPDSNTEDTFCVRAVPGTEADQLTDALMLRKLNEQYAMTPTGGSSLFRLEAQKKKNDSSFPLGGIKIAILVLIVVIVLLVLGLSGKSSKDQTEQQEQQTSEQIAGAEEPIN